MLLSFERAGNGERGYRTKSLVTDSVLNIIAAAVPLALLQLFVLPAINASVGESAYGLIVTLLSVFTLFPTVFGNTLNNIRLINDKEYAEKGYVGDFNIIGAVLAIVAMGITLIVGSFYIGSISMSDIVGLCFVSVLLFFSSYLHVGFLIALDYRRVLIKSVLTTVGYTVGLLVFWITNWWYWVYGLGYLAAVIYSVIRTPLAKEPYCRTPMFGHVVKSELVLLGSSWLGNVTIYADRLLLYPLIGGGAVAAYYASTLLGKMISLVIGPVSNVVLAHLGRADSVGFRTMRVGALVAVLFGVVVYVACMLVAQPVLSLLYPNLVDAAMQLVAITTATSIVQAWGSIINPVVLRFCNLGWQLLMGVVGIVTYVGFALLFFTLWGLVGFAFGVLASTAVSLGIRLALVFAKRAEISGA